MQYDRIVDGPSMEISREELADVAYMCYLLDRTQTIRWYHEWRVALDRMGREGWSMKGLYYRGLVKQRIEQIFGLSPFRSRQAMKAYPPVNLGLSPWQDLTDECIDDIARQIYFEYMGLFREGYAFHFGAGCEDDKSQRVHEGDPATMQADSEENLGEFYFV